MTSAVVLATYNGEKYIGEQIESILRQTRIPDMIVITDDASTDSTLCICEKLLSNSCCTYKIVKSDGKGVICNFYNGLKYVNQDIVFFSDQDDVWVSTKIEKIMRCFEQNPLCTEVLSNCFVWDGVNIPNETMRGIFGLRFPKASNHIFEKEAFWLVMLDENIATGMSMAFKRDILDEYKYFPKYVLHDSAINLIAAALGDVFYIDEPLAYYRQHKKNVVGAKMKFRYSMIKNMKKNLFKSIHLEEERLNLIISLDKQYHFLTLKNKSELQTRMIFLKEREEYIYNKKIIKLIYLVAINRQRYPSVLFLIRDLIVCLFANKNIEE